LLFGKRFTKCFVAVILAFTILITPQMMTPASASTSISALQQKQAQLKKQQTEIAAKLKSLKADKAKQLDYKEALDSQRATVQDQIDVLSQQVTALDSDITQKESEISAKQSTIATNYARLKERLHALYLTGEASNLEIILNAKSVMDLSDKTEAIKAITTHDTTLINTLKTDMESIKTQKAAIETNRKSVALAKTTKDSKQNELSSLVSETQAVIVSIGANQSSAQAQSAKLSQESKAADDAIDQWYKDYYAEQARKAHQNGGGGNSGGGSGGYVSKGNFQWPVPSCSNITSGYGSRDIGSGGQFHKGIDISRSGIYGAAIVAADSGRVMQAGFGNYGTGYGGYGNVIAIDHGGGFSTLYGHCSSVAVSAGSMVQKGQVIGYVGSTGNSTGPHLHFEIRVNGVAHDPMAYFGR